MLYESELRFLCDTFKKCRIKVSFLSPTDKMNSIADENFTIVFGENPYGEKTVRDFVSGARAYTIYKLYDSYGLCFIALSLPQVEKETILLIGPYLHDHIDMGTIFEIGERYGVPPQKKNLLEVYYAGLPVLKESSHMFSMLEIFCERIWGGSFTVEDVNTQMEASVPPLSKHGEEIEDVLVNMKVMEERYAAENELMRAVSLGQEHKVGAIFETLIQGMPFEKRLADPLRNLKNYSIITNTLLRKAAENGGVHPLYLDEISSSFAARIEQMSTPSAVQELMSEMFRSYCRLVRKHSMKKYSLVVQKTITLIDSDLSANLSLSSLATAQNISPGYLSTVFKRETGKTVTDYIISERMKLAMHMLGTTRLQVQTVALHCGIMDVQYFSKVFKRYTGKTPKEYRESIIG